MNKFALVLIVVSIAASSVVTYQVSRTGAVDLSGQYVKKDDLKKYFDQYVDQGAENIYAAALKGIEIQKKAEVEKQRMAILNSQDALENDPSTPFAGNEKGDVKIVMFSDYLCGYCKKSAPVLSGMLQKDTNLKLIIKEYPVLGQSSVVSAKAALAAFKLDKSKYPAFNKLLFTKAIRSELDLIEMATAAGLDAKVLIAEIAKPEYERILQQNRLLGSRLGVNGTPAFIIDGVLYPGAMGEAQLTQIINEVRAKRLTRKDS